MWLCVCMRVCVCACVHHNVRAFPCVIRDVIHVYMEEEVGGGVVDDHLANLGHLGPYLGTTHGNHTWGTHLGDLRTTPGDYFGEHTRRIHLWNSVTTLGDHTWETRLGTHLDHIWGVHVGGPHLGNTLGHHTWGTHLGDLGPHLGVHGDHIGGPHLGGGGRPHVGNTLGHHNWGTTFWGPHLWITLGDHIWGPHLGNTLFGDHTWWRYSRDLGPHFMTTFGGGGTTFGDHTWAPHLGNFKTLENLHKSPC